MTSIRQLKGVGEKAEQLFQKIGVNSIEDLLHTYPRTYDIYKKPVPIKEIRAGNIQAVEGMLIKAPEMRTPSHPENNTTKKSAKVVQAVMRDSTGTLAIMWFNMPFLQKTMRAGCRFVFRGKVGFKAGKLTMEQPKIYGLAEYDELVNEMQPIYSLTMGLTNHAVIKAIKQALELEQTQMRREYLPDSIRKKYQLAEYNFALKTIHFPKDMKELMIARRRLVFEEFFLFILALRKLRQANDITKNQYPMQPVSATEKLIEELPFSLTNAQKKVWKEIKRDLAEEKVMNRLVQGDVGSGKTMIAILTLLEAAENGYQAALMAPTEVLARQHYENILELFQTHHILRKPLLLTGSMTAKEKKEAYEVIANHEVDIIIGTHALIQEKVKFHRLGLVITDEQHRFGVRQREILSEKGEEKEAVHVLVMSATPIPRTLAIILYGDLDISVIDELPASRLPIKNCVVDTNYRPKAYRFIENEIQKGRQIYIICPMVEESEQMEAENVLDYTQMLKTHFSSAVQIEYLHGRMKPKEKNEIMERFSRNKIQILVSTTVIEVGVNVPNATVMMVENAERFGLAQLHQLRGRVGRGKEQSYCIFVSGSDKKETLERLEILNKSNDGFFIASEDLRLRGPGDLLGIRQSGIMEFKIGDVFMDANILQEASEAANEILKQDAELLKEEHQELGRYIEEYLTNTLGKINL